VVEFPAQTVVVPEIEDGAVDAELTVTVVLTHDVVLQVPVLRA
jgi:hypothetical protein